MAEPHRRFHDLPEGLPVPEDDGAAAHLIGLELPALRLDASSGGPVDLAASARPGPLVVYVYPATGVPGRPLPPEWDEIPGARGCTRLTFIARDGEIEQLFYPVFPPRQNAADVLAWLRTR